MYSAEIKSVITEYLNNHSAEYAIMIDGDWGFGKTYFIKAFLDKIVEEDNNKRNRRKLAYVSLYGAREVFNDVYNVGNINDSFLSGRKELEELCKGIEKMYISGNIKTVAKK